MKRKILLIDDDPDELEIFSDALSRIPIPTICAQVVSADNALSWLKKQQPDFIFIDFNMPIIDGIQCLEKIKSIPGLQPIPCVLYSNYVDEEMKTKAISLGAAAYMKKPYISGLLVFQLKEIFSQFLDTGNI